MGFSLRRNLTQMAGWVQVDLDGTGDATFSGHVHNDAFFAEAFEFSVRVVVGSDPAIAFEKSGSVGGTGATAQQRNFYWTDREASQAYALSPAAGQMQVYEARKCSITGVLASFASFVVSWVTGTTVQTLAPSGLILFGTELVAELTGAGPAAFAIVEGVACVPAAGPTILSVALPAAVQAEGIQQRPMTPQEYAWANEEIFGGTLPPGIVISNMIGLNSAPFTFPEFGGAVWVNLGPQDWQSPKNTDPVTFTHELTHAWQIAHDPLLTAWMGAELIAQINRERAYDLPPMTGQPWGSFNPEQQAVIVQTWVHNGYSTDPADPYFPYIQANIRAGLT